jgi:bifunctional polynucleotide phosphatase/kinase
MRQVSSKYQHPCTQLTTTTEKSASNFFTPTSQKKPDPITWRVVGTSVVIGKQITGKQVPKDGQRRIAGFDLVSVSLVISKSNRMVNFAGFNFDQNEIWKCLP